MFRCNGEMIGKMIALFSIQFSELSTLSHHLDVQYSRLELVTITEKDLILPHYRRRPRGFRRKALKPFGAGSLYPSGGSDCSPGGRHHHVGGHYDAAMAAHVAASGHHPHHHHHHMPVSVADFDASSLLPTTTTASSSNGSQHSFMLNNNVLGSYTGYTSYSNVEYSLPPIDGRPPPDFTDLGPAAPWPPCWGPADPYQAVPPPPPSGFASQVEAELALGEC